MRAWLLIPTLLLMLNLAACAPSVNSQGQARTLPAPTPAMPSEPAIPAAEVGVKVALLLPLTGTQEKLGQSLLNAAQLAVYDLADQNFALLPTDTAGTPQGAVIAMRQALADGAKVIIGPVFSAEVEAVAPIARARSIPLLALSNNQQLASDGVFILGPGPEEQIARVLAFARSRGVSRIAALVPANAYGAAVEEAVQQTARAQGFTLVKLERMAPGADPAMLAPAFATSLTTAGGADAIVLGEGGVRLPQLAAALRSNGITARLLGPAIWDSLASTNDPMLAGSWYAALPAAGRNNFRQRYQQTYNDSAAPIATLAYDATAVAAVLGKSDSGITRSALLSPTGFAGVDGIFRFNSDGSTERGLAVFELTNNGVRVIDAPPARFANAMN